MSDTELRNKITNIISSCSQLATDYKTKHNELTDVFDAFKLAVKQLQDTHDAGSKSSEDLINELLNLINNEAGDLLTDAHRDNIQNLRNDQQRLMQEFVNRSKDISSLVNGLENIANNAQNRLNSVQRGGSKGKKYLSKKNKKNKKTTTSSKRKNKRK